jgi:hypothetical protein
MTRDQLIKEASLNTSDSAVGCVTMAANTALQGFTRGFMCSTDGVSTLTLADGSSAQFRLIAGLLYPISIRSYASAGHTAGTIVALY